MENNNSERLSNLEWSFMGNCYSCKKNLGIFESRYSPKVIEENGYKPLEGMTKKDNLCKECVNEIKKTQQRIRIGSKLSVGWQVILCLIPFFHFFLQLYAFNKIHKVRKFLLYFVIMNIPPIILLVIGIEDPTYTILFYIGIVGLIGGYFIPIIWVVDWTKEFNKNLDQS